MIILFLSACVDDAYILVTITTRQPVLSIWGALIDARPDYASLDQSPFLNFALQLPLMHMVQ